ncbi:MULTISPECIES: hypothetical protein [unclassified Streptomyces]|uniref:hypothetical protein n=1 Tax=unclassified Streptomyces TaxID=2593676 RepID=UPI000B0C516D|nr:hypothetical protein [Streptomyces sp. Root1310]
MDQPMAAVESDLVDLTGVSLEMLRNLDGSTVAPSLAGILLKLDNPQASTSDFNPSHDD